MTPNEYQQAARTTLATDNERDTLAMCGLGIAGEAGEICDILKKSLFHKRNQALDTNKLVDEMGDLLWYIAVMASQFKIEMTDIMPVLVFGSGSSLSLVGLSLSYDAGNAALLLRNRIRYDYATAPYSNALRFRADLVDRLHSVVTDVAILLGYCGVTIEDVMQRNITKLQARHSGGVFHPHYVSDSVTSKEIERDQVLEQQEQEALDADPFPFDWEAML